MPAVRGRRGTSAQKGLARWRRRPTGRSLDARARSGPWYKTKNQQAPRMPLPGRLAVSAYHIRPLRKRVVVQGCTRRSVAEFDPSGFGARPAAGSLVPRSAAGAVAGCTIRRTVSAPPFDARFALKSGARRRVRQTRRGSSRHGATRNDVTRHCPAIRGTHTICPAMAVVNGGGGQRSRPGGAEVEDPQVAGCRVARDSGESPREGKSGGRMGPLCHEAPFHRYSSILLDVLTTPKRPRFWRRREGRLSG